MKRPAQSVIMIWLYMEMYRSGRNENDSKSFCLEIGTWVRIPPSPPNKKPADKIGRFFYVVL